MYKHRKPSRRRNETRFEYLKRRIGRVDSELKLALGSVAALAVAGALLVGISELDDKNTADQDKGTAKVGKCYGVGGRQAIKDPKQPKDTARGERLPKGSGVYLADIFLDSAINRLGEAAPHNGLGETRVSFSPDSMTPQTIRLLNAEEQVFYRYTESFYTTEYYDADGSETKLDDDSERFCTYEGKVYLTQEAVDAVAAMDNAGIGIDPHLSAATR